MKRPTLTTLRKALILACIAMVEITVIAAYGPSIICRPPQTIRAVEFGK